METDVGTITARDTAAISSARQTTIKEKMEMILDVGQLLMESGDDSKSIVRDMLRAAAYLGSTGSFSISI